MARYTGPRMRIARREGVLLPGITMIKRDYPPGQHGPKGRPRKVSQYGQQLREKQKAKRMFGLLERQFSNIVAKAMRRQGDSAEGLLELLERRLDNVVYRLGWTTTRQGARQLITHGDVLVNDKRLNIPSSIVSIGQTISLAKAVGNRPTWAVRSEALATYQTPRWLQATDNGKATVAGKVTALPVTQDGEAVLNTQAIIEFYSK